MNTFFKELFEYNYHFNQKLIDSFIENRTKTSERSVKLMSHILNAHQIWNNRIDEEDETFTVWQINSPEALKEIDQSNYEKSISILDEFNPTSTVQYTNSQGNVFTNSIRDILFHVINHSTYHRGQIAADFKQSGIDPLTTDYIFYKR